jgi:hypothetical protein
MAGVIVANCHFLLDWCKKSDVGIRLTFLAQLMLDALKLVASDLLHPLLQRSLGFMDSRDPRHCFKEPI